MISFTVETDGRLPTGQALGAAINEVDTKTDFGPAYFMLNCAHPDHFRETLRTGGEWRNRICGIRANASRLSHAELDDAEELDDGNPCGDRTRLCGAEELHAATCRTRRMLR